MWNIYALIYMFSGFYLFIIYHFAIIKPMLICMFSGFYLFIIYHFAIIKPMLICMFLGFYLFIIYHFAIIKPMLICMFLGFYLFIIYYFTIIKPMSYHWPLSIPSKNIRSPEVSWCFQGVKKRPVASDRWTELNYVVNIFNFAFNLFHIKYSLRFNVFNIRQYLMQKWSVGTIWVNL